MFEIFTKKKRKKSKNNFKFTLFEKPKPVKKSGSKRLDKKVSNALKKSGGKCVSCHKRKRVGESLFCRWCHLTSNY